MMKIEFSEDESKLLRDAIHYYLMHHQNLQTAAEDIGHTESEKYYRYRAADIKKLFEKIPNVTTFGSIFNSLSQNGRRILEIFPDKERQEDYGGLRCVSTSICTQSNN